MAMSRHPRIQAYGVLYHLMARENSGQTVYLEQVDSASFLQALQTARERYPFSLSASVLMPSHFHLLDEVKRAAGVLARA